MVYSPLLLHWIAIPEPPVSLQHVCLVTDLLEVVYVTDVECGSDLLDTPVLFVGLNYHVSEPPVLLMVQYSPCERLTFYLSQLAHQCLEVLNGTLRC